MIRRLLHPEEGELPLLPLWKRAADELARAVHPDLGWALHKRLLLEQRRRQEQKRSRHLKSDP